ncbi:MAG TPA: C25 family cysteine peptidase, partial [Luteolibacter sp.]
MKLHPLLLLAVLLIVCLPAQTWAAPVKEAPLTPGAGADFSWRGYQGDFPATQKTTYLILTTEHAVANSTVLPAFVKHKESIGYRVIVATEKDYGKGKPGPEYTFHLRDWLRDFQKRTNAKYALIIGDTHPGHADFAPPARLDGERRGMDEGYRDLDGVAIDAYLKNPNPFKPTQEHPGQELMIGRISYIPGNFGICGPYDLDRILEKTMNYERQTLSGKGLDWRANSLTLQTNYGSSDWDRQITDTTRLTGGMNEHWAHRGWNPATIVPQNYSPSMGVPVARNFYESITGYGFATNCSHGWACGSEGIGNINQWLNQDDRFPAVTTVTACTGLDPAYSNNQGQVRLRRGAIFVIGTAHSGNLNARAPFLSSIMKDRLTTGAAMGTYNPRWYGTMAYGDPSLAILPQAVGKPATTLTIAPMAAQAYVERSVDIGMDAKPFEQTYTLTNNTAEPIVVTASSNAAWLGISPEKITLAPGTAATVKASTTAGLGMLETGRHEATIRFAYPGQQDAVRYVALELRPVTIFSWHNFESVDGKPNYRDLTVVGVPLPRNPDAAKAQAVLAKGEVAPSKSAAWAAGGKVGGGCLQFKAPFTPWTKVFTNHVLWSGASAGFWFKLDALPKATAPVGKKPAPPAEFTIAWTNLYSLKVAADGALALKGKTDTSLGVIKPGEWHHVLLRSDVLGHRVLCTLDATPKEVAAPLDEKKALTQHFNFGNFEGSLDELKLWAGELSDQHRAVELAQRLTAPAFGNPSPHSGDIVHPTTPLKWEPMALSASTTYNLYLYSEVNRKPGSAPIFQKEGLKETAFTALLEPGKTYFWRVDAKDGTRTLRGPVQSFRTHPLPYANLADKPGTAAVLPIHARLTGIPGIPATATLDSASARIDLTEKAQKHVDYPVRYSLLGAPSWLRMTSAGVLSFAADIDHSKIDNGGYNTVLVAESGRDRMEQNLRVMIPLPDIRFAIGKTSKDELEFRPLGKFPVGSIIRYTTDGSPVTRNSTVYAGPVAVKGNLTPSARLFWGAYAFDTVSLDTPLGISHDGWKVIGVSGKWPRASVGIAAAEAVFDGTEKRFTHVGGTLPQSIALNMGQPRRLTSFACQSHIAAAS